MLDAELLERGASAGGEALDIRDFDEQEPFVIQDRPHVPEGLEGIQQVLQHGTQDHQAVAARQCGDVAAVPVRTGMPCVSRAMVAQAGEGPGLPGPCTRVA